MAARTSMLHVRIDEDLKARASQTLVEFLDSLPDPLVAYGLYTRCLECSHSYILCRQIVAQLSTASQNLFLYLTAFLRELLRHAPLNRLTADRLALLFGSVVLRPQPGARREHYSQLTTAASRDRAAFFLHFLVNDAA